MTAWLPDDTIETWKARNGIADQAELLADIAALEADVATKAEAAATTAALAGKAPIASPTFTGSVTVPTPAAAGHAAKVTAYDPVTGRFALDGVELGDTGWRNLTGLVTLTAGWNSPTILLRRKANTVSWIVNGIDATGTPGGNWIGAEIFGFDTGDTANRAVLNNEIDTGTWFPAIHREGDGTFSTLGNCKWRQGGNWSYGPVNLGYRRFSIGDYRAASGFPGSIDYAWFRLDYDVLGAWPTVLPGVQYSHYSNVTVPPFSIS